MASIVQYKDKLIRISSNRKSIEYSANTGYCWTLLTSSAELGIVNDLLADGEHLFAACENGLFYSGNGGFSWAMRAQRGSYGNFQSIGGNYSQLFAGTTRGFHTSCNGGYTWTLLHN